MTDYPELLVPRNLGLWDGIPLGFGDGARVCDSQQLRQWQLVWMDRGIFKFGRGRGHQRWPYHETGSSAVATVSGSSRSFNDCTMAANDRATLPSTIVRPPAETFTG